jgi:hypothetical protein
VTGAELVLAIKGQWPPIVDLGLHQHPVACFGLGHCILLPAVSAIDALTHAGDFAVEDGVAVAGADRAQIVAVLSAASRFGCDWRSARVQGRALRSRMASANGREGEGALSVGTDFESSVVALIDVGCSN